MKKKIVFIFAIICIILFVVFYYIFYISGNNIIRNRNEFVEDVFEKLENYEAKIKVNVISNKNENIYDMYQMVNKNYSKLVINYPENVKGLEIEFENDCLKIRNEKNNMEKIYENYKNGINNSLFLNTFIKEYKEERSEILETEEEIIVKINLDNNYIESKELYLNKYTKLPIKLLIKYNTQKNNTSIIYNDIKIK